MYRLDDVQFLDILFVAIVNKKSDSKTIYQTMAEWIIETIELIDICQFDITMEMITLITNIINMLELSERRHLNRSCLFFCQFIVS